MTFGNAVAPVNSASKVPRGAFQSALDKLAPTSLRGFVHHVYGSDGTCGTFLTVAPHQSFGRVGRRLRLVRGGCARVEKVAVSRGNGCVCSGSSRVSTFMGSGCRCVSCSCTFVNIGSHVFPLRGVGLGFSSVFSSSGLVITSYTRCSRPVFHFLLRSV